MKVNWFPLMPYPYLPADFKETLLYLLYLLLKILQCILY